MHLLELGPGCAEFFDATFEAIGFVQWPPGDVPLAAFAATLNAPCAMVDSGWIAFVEKQRFGKEHGGVDQIFGVTELYEHGAVIGSCVRRMQHGADTAFGIEPEALQQCVHRTGARPTRTAGSVFYECFKKICRSVGGQGTGILRTDVDQFADVVERNVRAPCGVNSRNPERVFSGALRKRSRAKTFSRNCGVNIGSGDEAAFIRCRTYFKIPAAINPVYQHFPDTESVYNVRARSL
ncbi:MAG: hypothetical protein JWO95_1387 [Verrucomicrobiales bacterium]|nr:hypothetical protein [Verrucomicrobiales bacterium]